MSEAKLMLNSLISFIQTSKVLKLFLTTTHTPGVGGKKRSLTFSEIE